MLTAAVPAGYGRGSELFLPPRGAALLRVYQLPVASTLPKGRWPWELFNGGSYVWSCFLFCSLSLSLKRVPFRLNFSNYSPLITARAG